ncbi:MAG: hypothetical protein RMJ84_05415 [Sandaracinaceae bacterium]|nr:hypothetical protein [Sandaracinaceae bacterium]
MPVPSSARHSASREELDRLLGRLLLRLKFRRTVETMGILAIGGSGSTLLLCVAQSEGWITSSEAFGLWGALMLLIVIGGLISWKWPRLSTFGLALVLDRALAKEGQIASAWALRDDPNPWAALGRKRATKILHSLSFSSLAPLVPSKRARLALLALALSGLFLAIFPSVHPPGQRARPSLEATRAGSRQSHAAVLLPEAQALALRIERLRAMELRTEEARQIFELLEGLYRKVQSGSISLEEASQVLTELESKLRAIREREQRLFHSLASALAGPEVPPVKHLKKTLESGEPREIQKALGQLAEAIEKPLSPRARELLAQSLEEGAKTLADLTSAQQKPQGESLPGKGTPLPERSPQPKNQAHQNPGPGTTPLSPSTSPTDPASPSPGAQGAFEAIKRAFEASAQALRDGRNEKAAQALKQGGQGLSRHTFELYELERVLEHFRQAMSNATGAQAFPEPFGRALPGGGQPGPPNSTQSMQPRGEGKQAAHLLSESTATPSAESNHTIALPTDTQAASGGQAGNEHDPSRLSRPSERLSGGVSRGIDPLHTQAGPSRRQVIREAGARGFTVQSYRRVYTDYLNHAEEALFRDRVPITQRHLVDRYFELISPHD